MKSNVVQCRAMTHIGSVSFSSAVCSTKASIPAACIWEQAWGQAEGQAGGRAEGQAGGQAAGGQAGRQT